MLIVQAAAQQGPGWPWVAVLGLGLALLAAATVRALAPLWTGLPGVDLSPGPSARRTRLWLGVGVLLVLLGGVYPAPLVDLTQQWAARVAYLLGP